MLPDDLYFSPHVQLVSQHTLSTGESLKRTVIWIFSPANLYLVGPDGQAVGTDPVTGQQHLDIDGASYTGPDTEPKVLAVPNLAGTWQLHVTGTATGTYDLLFEGIDNIHPRVLMTGTTAPGVDAIYTINRDAAGGLAAAPQDQTPPTTQLSIQGTLAPSGWYTTPVALVLNAVDGLPGTAVGVARTEYSLDNGSTWQIYQAPVTLTDGTYTMLYRSVDYVNNVEPAQSVHLQIDTVPPVVNLSTDQSQYTRLAAPVVHASAFDPAPGSGLASFQVLFGNQIVIDGQTLDLFWLPLGTYTLTGTAQDRAGWITARSSSFTLIATLDSLRATILRLHQLGEIDNDGVTNSFLAKVDAATYAASREQGTAARNQLDALIHELAAQNGHHITAGAATLLTEDVRYVRVHLR